MKKFSLIDLEAAMPTRRNSKHRDRERLSERTTGNGRCDSLNCKEMELAEGGRNDHSSEKASLVTALGRTALLSLRRTLVSGFTSPDSSGHLCNPFGIKGLQEQKQKSRGELFSPLLCGTIS